LEDDVTLFEEIQKQVQKLPPDKQKEVLDFARDLERRKGAKANGQKKPLRQHPAFGSWGGRNVDALKYQETLRAEWNNHK
jgi:hypothetical protein